MRLREAAKRRPEVFRAKGDAGRHHQAKILKTVSLKLGPQQQSSSLNNRFSKGWKFSTLHFERLAQVVPVNVVKIAFCGVVLLLASCAQVKQDGPRVDEVTPRWTVSEAVYEQMEQGKGSIEISLNAQKLVLRDAQGQAALETDCSTGIPGKETPTGTFLIKERIVDKRSNKYGKYVSTATGEVVVEKSWEVDKKPPGTRYRGIAMPYWMRLTWDGVGIHVGKFPRGYRSSFGCVRVPEEIQPRIFAKSATGMPVRIMD